MQIDKIDAVLLDLDGTIYYGTKLIPGAIETIQFFRQNEIDIYFTTNNSTKTRRQVFEKLIAMGVDCRFDEVLTSGYIAALYAKKNNLKDIYIFGSDNLHHEFEVQGIDTRQDEKAQNLLIGYAPDMTYEGLTSALHVALHAKCIMACNRERRFPGENQRIMPGCGAMTAPIEWCANRKCDVIIGKPSKMMIDVLVEKEKYSYERILVIGDTYESDVAMAKAAGSKSILLCQDDDCDKYTDTAILRSIADVPCFFKKY